MSEKFLPGLLYVSEKNTSVIFQAIFVKFQYFLPILLYDLT